MHENVRKQTRPTRGKLDDTGREGLIWSDMLFMELDAEDVIRAFNR